MPDWIKINEVAFCVADDLPHWFWSGVNEGRWEPETFNVIDRFLAPDWRFVDMGAWIGPMTLYAAKKCERIDAFECDPVAIRQLRNNLALNNDVSSKVRLHEYGLSDADGFFRIFSRVLGNSETSIFLRHERDGEILNCNESIIVGCRDVRSIFREYGYANCDRTFVKIDVEGAEFKIVPYLADLIADSRCVWCVSFHELNVNPPDIPPRYARISEMLRSLSTFARLHWYGPDLRELDKHHVLNSVLAETWPFHQSFIFSHRQI